MLLILMNLIINLVSLVTGKASFFWFFKVFTILEILIECLIFWIFLIA